MASRKTDRAFKKRPGLRSQWTKPEMEQEDDWETAVTSEEELPGFESQRAKPKTRRLKSGQELEGSPSNTEVIHLFREFLAAQQRRDDILQEELRGLRGSLEASRLPVLQTSPVGPSAATEGGSPSPRLELPTPRPRREGPPDNTAFGQSLTSSPSRLGNPAVGPSAVQRKEPKMPVYQHGEDIENYLLRFERMARTWQWPKEEWAYRLIPLLTGKALEAYTAMDEDRSNCYPDLREALLVKFDISPETYRQRFRATSTPPGETPTETYHRLRGLYRRWVRPERKNKDQLGETIILEQLLQVFPPDIRMWVREHEPEDGLTAAKLALKFLNARRGATSRPTRGDTRENIGHRDNFEGNRGVNVKGQTAYSAIKTLVCYHCQQQGHKASVCPLKKPKVTGLCYVPRKSDQSDHQDKEGESRSVPVKINGKPVTALLDSGSSMSFIRKRYVPCTIDYSQQTEVLCVHGDCKPEPQVELIVEVDGQKYLMTVGVVENLPVEMLLGRDLPVLYDLLSKGNSLARANEPLSEPKMHVSCFVMTRSQAKTKALSGLQPLPDLCGSLCKAGTKGPRKTRRQRRLEKHAGTPVTCEMPESDLSDLKWEVPENVAVLQQSDPVLRSVFTKVLNSANHTAQVGGAMYVLHNDILYEGEEPGSRRLVVPGKCRSLVLHLAHTIPWAGHLAHYKTYLRLASRFFWPSMYTDVQTYCKTCPECQKTSAVRKSDRAPLQAMPVITTPFKRIAMDIVGPLEKSSAGYQYILVVCDYATRFPEAFPLRSVTTPKLISALVQLFSRVGIPEEILTDQGTNFTSNLMKRLHKELGITAIRTSPYHPETDGLVERFNQTLKRMLRKFVSDTGKDWDKWLPFLLFAYREVPQASTGFSPFELLYGWPVQGPLDLLKQNWEEKVTDKADEGKGVVQYVLQMRDRLEQYREEARHKLLEAQRTQKLWYDQKARKREFKPGQKVLLLLPSSSSKLLTKWQGPFEVLRKMGPTTYEILHLEKGKKKQTYHVNLLKAWEERCSPPSITSLLARRVTEEDDSEGVVEAWKQPGNVDLSHLDGKKPVELQVVFNTCPQLFTQKPGHTDVLQHVIRVRPDHTPVRQACYRVPERLVEALKEEIHLMLKLGVIEPSESECSSPIVIVPKKDGSLRICIDFRKLNAISFFDAYPMPRIEDLLERIGRANYITTLDLCKGYWQVPLESRSRPLTAFRTPLGLFQFTVMPFGLHGAPATFQRLMDRVLRGCEDCSTAYLDDVVVFSMTWEEHLEHIRRVLGAINAAGLTLNLQKCEWAKQETRYLGYLLGRGEVRPQVDKVEAIRNSPRPRTKTQVRSFLGLVGWYRRFIPQFATLATPLTNLTC